MDMLKAFVSIAGIDLVLMIPVSLLYFIVKDYMEEHFREKGGFYIAGIIGDTCHNRNYNLYTI